jgi:hypothetical protein
MGTQQQEALSAQRRACILHRHSAWSTYRVIRAAAVISAVSQRRTRTPTSRPASVPNVELGLTLSAAPPNVKALTALNATFSALRVL